MLQENESVIGKIFTSGHSQALRLPKAVRFSKEVKEVEIIKRGDELIVRPKKKKMTQRQWQAHWKKYFDSLSQTDADFMSERPLNKPLNPRSIF